MVKRIAVVTGTRADFGLLQPLLDKIVADPETELQLIATGMHLSPEFGMTVTEVRDAGYEIADEIEILLSSDSSVGTAKSVGLATIGFADSFRRLRPDWIVVLGDRFEILGASTAAMLMGLPVAHIHGGERTEGAVDEAIRHSVTKMSTLHFVSTPEYRKRVIQLGEPPERVHHIGAIGLDRINYETLLPKDKLGKDLGIDPGRPWCTVTFHPVTLEPDATQDAVKALTGALDEFSDMFFIITKANADEGGRLMNQILGEYAASRSNSKLFDSLGSARYLSCVYASELVLGNSSSAIIEAPHLLTPSVDIGSRQQGRARGDSVVHCETSQNSIVEAVRHARQIKAQNPFPASPYYNGGAANPIMEVLKRTPPSRVKRFHDIEFDC